MTAARGGRRPEGPWLSSLTHGSLHPLRSCGSDKQRPFAPFPYLCRSMETEGLAPAYAATDILLCASSRGHKKQDVILPMCFGRVQDPTFPRCEVHVVTGEDNRSNGCSAA